MKIAVGARDRIAQEILRSGPVTAAELAEHLGMTTAGVRRHLELLEAAGLVSEWSAPPRQRRGRGRPARSFVLTDAGHAAMNSEYDALAVQALRFIDETVGREAVRSFATRRARELAERTAPLVSVAGSTVTARARALAAGLTDDGYEASIRPVGGQGVQLCQGHCPVQDVAREFPELCEAEAEMFSEQLGVHVQRLATLAHGEHVCTTYIPTEPIEQPDPTGAEPPVSTSVRDETLSERQIR